MNIENGRSLIVAAIAMLILDIIWLRFFLKSDAMVLIRNVTGHSLKINYIYAGMAYILMIIGLYMFILNDMNGYEMSELVTRAFVLGVIIYGVYETTNGAIIESWDPMFMIKDTLWGGFLFAIVTYIAVSL